MIINNSMKNTFLEIGQRVKDYIAYKKVKMQEQARGDNRYEKYNCVKFNRLEMDYDPQNMEILRKLHIVLDELREKIQEENFTSAKIENINIGEGKCFTDINITIDGYSTRIIDDIIFKKLPWFGIKAYEITPHMYDKLNKLLPNIYKQVEKLEKLSIEYSVQFSMQHLIIKNGIVTVNSAKIIR